MRASAWPYACSDAIVLAIPLDEAVDVDAVILQTDHAEYLHLDWSRFCGCKLVLDGRNFLDPEPIARAGIAYVGIGRGTPETR